MVKMYYQKHKEIIRKEARERYQMFLKKKKTKGKKRPEKDIKVLLKKEKRRYQKRKQKLREYRRYYLTKLNVAIGRLYRFLGSWDN